MNWFLTVVLIISYFSIAGLLKYSLSKTILTSVFSSTKALTVKELQTRFYVATILATVWPLLLCLGLVAGFLYFFLVRVEIPEGVNSNGRTK